MYLYEHDRWTEFFWDESAIASLLGNARFAQGVLLGKLSTVGFDLALEAEVASRSSEVISSSIIEGVRLETPKVRSSIARRLGADALVTVSNTKDVDYAVEVSADAIDKHDKPLDAETLFSWHACLFPTGYSGLKKIRVADWRTSPMQVVSGPIGHERVHYEAPPAQQVNSLMNDFIAWYNAADNVDPLIKAGIAHLWILTIHPFEDGNGRISRGLTESILVNSDGSPRRFYSMSAYIAKHRDEYYYEIEKAQKGTSDITRWLSWFLSAIESSIELSLSEIEAVIERSAFWSSIDSISLNQRQRKVLSLLIDDFEGKLTSKKWAKLCKVSDDTALRDINGLIKLGILKSNEAKGRSTSYSLVEGLIPIHLSENYSQ